MKMVRTLGMAVAALAVAGVALANTLFQFGGYVGPNQTSSHYMPLGPGQRYKFEVEGINDDARLQLSLFQWAGNQWVLVKTRLGEHEDVEMGFRPAVATQYRATIRNFGVQGTAYEMKVKADD